MHEIAWAIRLVNEADGEGIVKRMRVGVGELAPVRADDLRTALSGMVGYEIEVIETPAEVRCVCGYTGEPEVTERGHDYVLYQCPQCGGAPEVLSGKDIKLASVDVEE